MPNVSAQGQLAAAGERLKAEFAGVFDATTVVATLYDSYDKLLAGAKILDFLPGLSERFSRERLNAVAHAAGTIRSSIPEVLFVCVHNAGRSQMAAGLLSRRSNGAVNVRSAGSEPADQINPAVVEAMRELEIDLSQAFPKPLTDEVVRAADVVITMGCGDACPIYPGKRYLDWDLPDPKGQDLAAVREIRDEIDRRVKTLLAELRIGVAP